MRTFALVLALGVGLVCGAAWSAGAADDPENCRVLSGDVAIEACNRVINSGKYTDGQVATAYANRGQEYYTRKDYPRALSDFSSAIRIGAGPDIMIAFGNRANVHYMKDEYEQAIADYSEAIRRDSKYTSAYTGRGLANEKLGRKDRAVADFKKALSVPQKYDDGKWAHETARKHLQALGGNN